MTLQSFKNLFNVRTDNENMNKIMEDTLSSVYVINSQLVLFFSIPSILQKFEKQGLHITSSFEPVDFDAWLETLNSYSGRVEIDTLSKTGKVTDTMTFNVETFGAGESIFDYTTPQFNPTMHNVVAVAKIINID